VNGGKGILVEYKNGLWKIIWPFFFCQSNGKIPTLAKASLIICPKPSTCGVAYPWDPMESHGYEA